MAMIKTVECKNCGATELIMVADDTYACPYCGTTTIVDKEIVNNITEEHIHNHYEKAKLELPEETRSQLLNSRYGREFVDDIDSGLFEARLISEPDYKDRFLQAKAYGAQQDVHERLMQDKGYSTSFLVYVVVCIFIFIPCMFITFATDSLMPLLIALGLCAVSFVVFCVMSFIGYHKSGLAEEDRWNSYFK